MASPNCAICSKAFGFFRWRYNCLECNSTICNDCSTDILDNIICNSCFSQLDKKMDTILVTRYPFVKGAEELERKDKIFSNEWHRNRDNAIKDIKWQCVRLSCNAVVALHMEQETHSEPGGGKGRHYYRIYRASGIPVSVKWKV